MTISDDISARPDARIEIETLHAEGVGDFSALHIGDVSLFPSDEQLMKLRGVIDDYLAARRDGILEVDQKL